MKWLLALAFLLCFSTSIAAQTYSDDCEVYLVDKKEAEKLLKLLESGASEQEMAKQGAKSTIILGKFSTTIGEEELTTKSYKFPGTKLFVTASVFYTDESMASEGTSSSMLVGIVLGPREYPDATLAPNNSMAEVSQRDESFSVRVKRNLTVNQKDYLIGLECKCKRKDTPKEE
ncbi:MAG: hypothetical protein JNN15_04430 [Blastocatellia bacterium]|nr:hypothetical protein [Blastocatellia bacterium]